jgi:hypothetical protein
VRSLLERNRFGEWDQLKARLNSFLAAKPLKIKILCKT